jgi:hypothetical protein
MGANIGRGPSRVSSAFNKIDPDRVRRVRAGLAIAGAILQQKEIICRTGRGRVPLGVPLSRAAGIAKHSPVTICRRARMILNAES